MGLVESKFLEQLSWRVKLHPKLYSLMRDEKCCLLHVLSIVPFLFIAVIFSEIHCLQVQMLALWSFFFNTLIYCAETSGSCWRM